MRESSILDDFGISPEPRQSSPEPTPQSSQTATHENVPSYLTPYMGSDYAGQAQQYMGLRQARRETVGRDRSFIATLMDRLPGVRSGFDFGNALQADQAQQRVNNNQGTPQDWDRIAATERLREIRQQQTAGESLGESLMTLPATAAEFMTAGRALGTTFQAAQGATLGARVLAGTQQAAATTGIMGNWLPRWAENNQANGRRALDLRGLPPAFGHEMATVAVLGSLGEFGDTVGANSIGGFIQRGLARVGLGMLEQGALDTVTSGIQNSVHSVFNYDLGLDAGYGLVGQVARGEGGEAIANATQQALTFAVFAGMHEAGRTPVMREYSAALRDLHKSGVSRAEAGRQMESVSSLMQGAAERDLSRSEARLLLQSSPAEGAARRYGESLLRTIPEHVDLATGLRPPQQTGSLADLTRPGTPESPTAKPAEPISVVQTGQLSRPSEASPTRPPGPQPMSEPTQKPGFMRPEVRVQDAAERLRANDAALRDVTSQIDAKIQKGGKKNEAGHPSYDPLFAEQKRLRAQSDVIRSQLDAELAQNRPAKASETPKGTPEPPKTPATPETRPEIPRPRTEPTQMPGFMRPKPETPMPKPKGSWNFTGTRFREAGEGLQFTGRNGQNYQMSEHFIQAGERPSSPNGGVILRVHDESGREVAHVGLFRNKEGHWQGEALHVDKSVRDSKERRTGVAAAMYDYIASQGGHVLPSEGQTPEGKRFWERNRMMKEERPAGLPRPRTEPTQQPGFMRPKPEAKPEPSKAPKPERAKVEDAFKRHFAGDASGTADLVRMGSLSKEEAKVLFARMTAETQPSLRAIAKEMGVSYETVRKLEVSALGKLDLKRSSTESQKKMGAANLPEASGVEIGDVSFTKEQMKDPTLRAAVRRAKSPLTSSETRAKLIDTITDHMLRGETSAAQETIRQAGELPLTAADHKAISDLARQLEAQAERQGASANPPAKPAETAKPAAPEPAVAASAESRTAAPDLRKLKPTDLWFHGTDESHAAMIESDKNLSRMGHGRGSLSGFVSDDPASAARFPQRAGKQPSGSVVVLLPPVGESVGGRYRDPEFRASVAADPERAAHISQKGEAEQWRVLGTVPREVANRGRQAVLDYMRSAESRTAAATAPAERAMTSIYRKMPDERVRADAQKGVKAAQAELARRTSPEFGKPVTEAERSVLPGGGQEQLPPVGDNYRRPLKDFTDTLYHETNINNALEMIPGTHVSAEPGPMYVSNARDLATGQGHNKGVMLTFDTGNMEGQVNRAKPMWEPAYKQGMAEFHVRQPNIGDLQKQLRSIEIATDAKASKPEAASMKRLLSKLEKEGWDRSESANGTTWTRPDAAEKPSFGRPVTEAERQVLPGGGQPNAGEVPPMPLKTAAIANESIDAWRDKQGMTPIFRDARMADPAVWDQAMERLSADPMAGSRLVDDIIAKPRSTTDVENALLLQRTVALRNERDRSAINLVEVIRQRQIERNQKIDNPETNARYAELERIDNELADMIDKTDKASRISGSEWGKAGRWRRVLVAEDFTLAGMLRSAEVAAGRPLTEGERVEIVDLNQKIAELQKKLDEAEANGKVKPGSGSNEGFAVDQVRKKFTRKVAVLKETNAPITVKAMRAAGEAVNVPRAIMTSIDFPLLRQGQLVMASHPSIAMKAIPEMLKSYQSDTVADRALYDIKHRPNAAFGDRVGLEITDRNAPITGREEGFLSRFMGADNIAALKKSNPQLGTVAQVLTSVPRASERSYQTVMNRLRSEMFDMMIDKLARNGKVTDAEGRVIANYVNVMTGRGPLGAKGEKAAQLLSQVFFAPRWTMSRFQYVLGQPLLSNFGESAPRARKMIAMEYARTLSGIGVALAAAAAAGLAVVTDPRSSAFGQVQAGNTFLDFTGGLRRPTTLLSQLWSGSRVDSYGVPMPIRGDVPHGQPNASDQIWRYVRSSFAPAPGAAVDLASGQDLGGRPVSVAGEAGNMVSPLFIRDVVGAMKDLDVPQGTTASLLALMGMSMQTRDAQPRPTTPVTPLARREAILRGQIQSLENMMRGNRLSGGQMIRGTPPNAETRARIQRQIDLLVKQLP